jgi:hypothetical protein
MTALLLILALLAAPRAEAAATAAAASPPQPRTADTQSFAELRDRVRARYEVLSLSRGIALRPKERGRATLIEIMSDGEIAVDGDTVSGRELRDRLGDDADLILQVSYLDADQRRALAGPAAPAVTHEPPPPHEEPTQPPAPEEPPTDRRPRRHIGERVAIFGSVSVDRDSLVDGQVVTVFGSSRIDGHVDEQVVAVFGSVDLGPESRVDGDVTVVGGELRRAPGSVVTGSVREIGLGGAPDIRWSVPWWSAVWMFDPFSHAARMMGTVFRLVLLVLVGAIAILIAREPVERIAGRITQEPLKAAVVGVLAELLFVPMLVMTCVILAISIIGIPLLLFVPFLVVGLLFVLLGGFIGAAYSMGRLAAPRLGLSADQPFVQMLLGIIIIFTPLLLARIFGMVGGPMFIFGGMLAAIAFVIEYFAWTIGFGAALIGASDRWRSRRVTTDSTDYKPTDSTDYKPTDSTDYKATESTDSAG